MVRPVAILALALLAFAAPASLADVPVAARVVRDEALRPQGDPGGRPLPLVAHWHRLTLPLDLQVQLIRDGHPFLPWLDYHRTRTLTPGDVDALATLREWQLPFALLTGGQWEADFYLSTEYAGLPIEQTGLADDLAGLPVKKVSPFSPVAPWRELGRRWTDNAAAKAVVAAYPDPPLVLFISNNEAQELRWTDAETSKAYVDAYGTEQTDWFKRQVFGDGWIERYAAMFEGMREGLPEGPWRSNSRFVGYNAFGPDHWGRWGGWRDHSLVAQDRASPEWFMWNGAIVDVYDNHWEPQKTAFNLWSLQTETMNRVFMKAEALQVQPEFWLETISWDGNMPGAANDKYALYRSLGVEYTPEVYGGWVQYAMWLVLPRVAREWRLSTDDRQRWWPHFEQVIAAVERVHADLVLRRFWRVSELVPNTARSHPFNVWIPARWSGVQRWYHQATSTDPPLPAEFRTSDYATIQFPVWTLVRVQGTEPSREWLVYAHAPLGERVAVTVDVPGYRPVQLPRVAVGGSFYHLVEATGGIIEVGLASGPLTEAMVPTPRALQGDTGPRASVRCKVSRGSGEQRCPVRDRGGKAAAKPAAGAGKLRARD